MTWEGTLIGLAIAAVTIGMVGLVCWLDRNERRER